MSRRRQSEKRKISPDPVYGSVDVEKFTNRLMRGGKKSIARKALYDAMEKIKQDTNDSGLEIFEQAVKNATPILEVKPRRVGGATYQVPVEVRPRRATTLAIRWLVSFARDRRERTMSERLANELLDASNGIGATVKRREDTHKMAEANKAFAHYRW